MRLENKVALITGAGAGLGRESAMVFAREGASIVVADIDQEGGTETVRNIIEAGGEATFVKADVSNSAEVKDMVAAIIEKYHRLDIVFNNAGIPLPLGILETSEEDWDRVLDVNLKSVFLVSKYAIPELIKSGGGSIINMASTLGIYAAIDRDAICTSKGGIISLTKAMSLDCAKYNIRVNCICPGPILTKMFQYVLPGEDYEVKRAHAIEHIPLARLGLPEEVANSALFLASDESSYVTGIALPVDGGLLAGKIKN